MNAYLAGAVLLAVASCHALAQSGADAPGRSMPMGPGMMRGGGMGGMMGSGGMGSMREFMAWMNGAELGGAPTEPRPAADDALRALGARLYGQRCIACHGEKGDGRGKEAARLSVPPRDFTRGVYKLRSTPTGALPTDEDLFATISRGMHGTAMLPWVSLTERERWALVAYIKTFSPRFAEEQAPAPIAVPTAPAPTTALAEKGRAVYLRVKCGDCHGQTGHGDGPSAPTLHDDAGRPAHPSDFAQGRFRRGTRMEDIFLTLHTGLDGSPMPSFESALTPDETWALAAFVRSLVSERSMPGGMMCPMMDESADSEERLGMMIDMPGMPSGMGGMQMGPSGP